MTKTISKFTKTGIAGTVFIFTGIFMMGSGCKKKDTNTTTSTGSYQQVSLVADTSSLGATRIDTKLANAWGIAIGSTGDFWISANHSGSTLIYDYTGAQIIAPVNIPLGALSNGTSPSGVVYNSSTDFVIPGNGSSSFIYATEDGILSAWSVSTGASTKTVDSSLTGGVFKGLAIASNGGANFIYVADFHNAKIVVYNNNFTMITTMPFSDPAIPAGFAPFNIQNIGGQLYVTYAKQLAPLNHDDVAGAGNGYIDVYTAAGILVKRFASQGTLNSPWGIVRASGSFGVVANAILVGNFGDGHINIFDANGAYQGQLLSNGTALIIPGLWALTYDNVIPANPDHLYFTSGPGSGSQGLFGYIKKM